MELLRRTRKFSVIFFSADMVRGASFQRLDKQWKLERFAAAEVQEKNPSSAWKSVLKVIGRKDELMLVTGSVPESLFFRFSSVELTIKEQRGAVELELPRRVLQLPEERLVQFAAGRPADDGQVGVSVCVFPKDSTEYLIARLSQCSYRADNYIYPFLAADGNSPLLYMPEVEKSFALKEGSWMMVSDAAAAQQETTEKWQEMLEDICQLPADEEFDLFSYLPLLVVARMVISGDYDRNRSALEVLPAKLRPVRYRQHLTVTAILLLLIIGAWAAGVINRANREFHDFNILKNENTQLKQKISNHRKQHKKKVKELKEKNKVLTTKVGERQLMQKFAVLANALPGNVLVSSMRWSDTGVDVVMWCENENLNLPALLSPLGLWKVEVPRQNSPRDSAVSTIILRLTSLDAAAQKEEKRRK